LKTSAWQFNDQSDTNGWTRRPNHGPERQVDALAVATEKHADTTAAAAAACCCCRGYSSHIDKVHFSRSFVITCVVIDGIDDIIETRSKQERANKCYCVAKRHASSGSQQEHYT
jgi:hypothetical protein